VQLALDLEQRDEHRRVGAAVDVERGGLGTAVDVDGQRGLRREQGAAELLRE